MAHNIHPDDLPTYNLKAVVQETGLKQDTLRAWERRYGLPQPDRTSGGHRLYSQRDIEILKWLVARQNEGLSISRAVDLWHRLVAEGQDPLIEMPTSTTASIATPPSLSAPGSNIEQLREAWIEACLDYDEKHAEQLLAQAAALYSPEVMCLEFLQKGLAEIGQMWFEGEVTVQQEHFASTLAIRRLEALIAGAPSPSRPGKILVACPPEELHVFGLLMVTFLLRRSGWDTVFLGANVPISHLEDTIEAVQPNLVVLAAQQIYTAATLLEVSQVLHESGTPVAFGGRIFNQVEALRDYIPGYFLGEHLEQVAQIVKQVLSNTLPEPGECPVSSDYQIALTHFRDRQTLIETAVWNAVNADELSLVALSYWNLHTARNIIGSLILGDMAFLNEDWTWTRDMLLNYNKPPETLARYLAIYHQATKTHLDNRGKPVIDWLAQFANQ